MSDESGTGNTTRLAIDFDVLGARLGRAEAVLVCLDFDGTFARLRRITGRAIRARPV